MSTPSTMSVMEKVKNLPFANSMAMGLCIGTYLIQVIVEPPVHNYTMNPRMVIYLKEYYRMISSCLFHGSMMHIGMNMMSAAAIGYNLEKKYGTLYHGITILWSMILTSSIYIVISYLLHLVFGYDHLMHQHSLGFSGVLFHLSVLEAHYSPRMTRNVFGFGQVSSTTYPWILLLVLQFFMPNLSFLGHLSGILIGTLQVYGSLDSICFPSPDYLRKLEQQRFPRLQQLSSNNPGYIPTPSDEELRQFMNRSSSSGDRTSLRTAIRNGLIMVWTFVCNVAETIKVCLFGYGGSNNNRNVQFTSEETSVLGFNFNNNNTNVEDHSNNDWIGLPETSQSKTTISTPESQIV